jgi:catechol 2,3-dioxygenase-like lactoylglutathione lyase family enzyme
MARVTGIGGIFFKARDPAAQREWYRKHLGLDIQSWGGLAFDASSGVTAWSIFPESTTHFAPSTAPFMINYRVEDLMGLVEAMRAEGVAVEKVESSAEGKFAWVMDPEGNRIELWEPAPEAAE